MSDTPNSRLARVLRILADVAERGDEGGLMVARAMHFALVCDFDAAEVCATEAARLAGVPLDGWRRPDAVPVDEFVLVTVRDMDIDGGKPYVCESILCESQDEGTYEWCMRPDYNDEPAPLLGGSVLAWRPRPAPYRPEETTDGTL